MLHKMFDQYDGNGHDEKTADLIFTVANNLFASTFVLALDENGKTVFVRGVPTNVNVPEILNHLKTHDMYYPDLFRLFTLMCTGEYFIGAGRHNFPDGRRVIFVANGYYSQFRSLLVLLLLELLCLIIPPALFIYFSSKKLQQQINRIVTATATKAKEIADGNYTKRLSYDKPNEFTSIADSFNSMADKVQENTAALAAFSANVVHEIHNPISSIKIAAEFISRQSNDASAAAVAAQLIDETRRIEQMIASLKTLSVLDVQNSAEKLVYLEVVLDELFDEIITNHAEEISTKNLHVYTDTKKLPILASAPSMLRLLLENLINNAIKFTPANGTIHINTTCGNGKNIITVSDTGPGIHAADLPHLFERFYRSTAAFDVPGSGLGLAIVKKAAESLGGIITVSSTAGRGTKFSCEFPA
ncbi:MAG: HAMP domain-containing sensor histidine kinase [Negativicutes bacterium]